MSEIRKITYVLNGNSSNHFFDLKYMESDIFIEITVGEDINCEDYQFEMFFASYTGDLNVYLNDLTNFIGT